MVGIEVLDQDECHAAVGRHFRKERLEGVDAASRCADPYNQIGSVRYIIRLGDSFIPV
ncbi:hypothetical protein SAE02_71470 [Skermanella aerolata]|uniref:Uncharacterized protein n=1 Tax=Skermanella aerolata TaxID=393310 RepID=A0A512E2Q1_9PROT|nr:hypothetical protein SAE02_71470 [Skermanella aerolata]